MNEFSYSYFSGANVSITVNNTYLDCAGISYKLLSSKQPIYSHYSPRYDMLSTSRQIIQGSFVINYTKADYLFYILVNDPILYDQVKSITTQYTTSERTRHPGYYLQYNNVKAFDIEIDFGKNNFTILKNCYITSRAQTINIDDNVLLEEYSFVAREIKIRQGENVKENESQNKASSTVELTPPEIKPKIDPLKPLAVVTESKPVDPPKTVANTAVTETINKKIDDKTTEAVKVEQVKASGGIEIPVEKKVETKTTKTELDGTRSQSIELVRKNVFAMQKIIDDAKKFYPDENYDTTTKEKRSKYIFDEFKKMTGGIPPSSRFLPSDMRDEEQLKKYYADGAEFVETLAVKAEGIKKLTFDDFNPDSKNNVLDSFHNVKKWKKDKAITQGEYYAALNTLFLTSKVMLPVSTGELAHIAKWSNDTNKQADGERIITMKNFHIGRIENFKNSYDDVENKNTLLMPFGWSPNLDYITSDDNGSSLGGSNLISSKVEYDINDLKKRFVSKTLSIDNATKGITKENIKQWNETKENINTEISNPIGPSYYQFNNFYDSISFMGNNVFKDRNKLPQQEKNIVNLEWLFSKASNNYDEYLKNPLDFFNGVSYYSNDNKGVYFQNFLDSESIFNPRLRFTTVENE